MHGFAVLKDVQLIVRNGHLMRPSGADAGASDFARAAGRCLLPTCAMIGNSAPKAIQGIGAELLAAPEIGPANAIPLLRGCELTAV